MTDDRELNDILDQCLERILVGGDTVEQSLEGYPEQVADLEPLLRTALAASRALDVQPDPEFRARARYQFYSELARVKAPGWWALLSWQPRWAAVLAVIMVVVLAGGGTVLAADSSMPDSPLYPVKLATENVRLKLSSSDANRARVYATLADRRVVEITRMVEKGKAKLAERATEHLASHLVKIVRLSAVVRKAEVAVQAAQARLEAQAAKERPSTDNGTAERHRRAAEVEIKRAAKRAADMKKQITRLKVALGKYAVDHPATLRAAYDNAPDSAKPAIRRAITDSVNTYRKALDELK